MQNHCPKRKNVTKEWMTVLVNKSDKTDVVVRIQDLIKDCFGSRCCAYDHCTFHDEIYGLFNDNKHVYR